MIYILHGDNAFSSYNHLTLLQSKYKDLEKIRLSDKNSYEDYVMANYSKSIFNTQRIIIIENFISLNKITPKEINTNVHTANVLIFWEKNKLFTNKLKSISANVKISEFKTPPTLFYFLDSISKGSKTALKNLEYIGQSDQVALLWNLTNRMYLIILAKLGIAKKSVSLIMGKQIQDWQWAKILDQSKKLSFLNLYRMMDGLLKIDYFAKSGKTSIDEKSMISLLLLKYLP